MKRYHITATEQESILYPHAQGCGIRKIAGTLNRSPSTINRELRRNLVKGAYSATSSTVRRPRSGAKPCALRLRQSLTDVSPIKRRVHLRGVRVDVARLIFQSLNLKIS